MTDVSVIFERNADNFPEVTFYHLQPEHYPEMRRLLLENGQDVIYNMRSEAGAHLTRWNPHSEGVISVEFRGENPFMFIHKLCDAANVEIHRVPNEFPTTIGGRIRG